MEPDEAKLNEYGLAKRNVWPWLESRAAMAPPINRRFDRQSSRKSF